MKIKSILCATLALCGVLPCLGHADAVPPAHAFSLQAGSSFLTLTRSAIGQYGLHLGLAGGQTPAASFQQPQALDIDMVDGQGEITHLACGYHTVSRTPSHGLLCVGTLRTARGSVFHIRDTYAAAPHVNGFWMTRQVTVDAAKPTDVGFNSEFSVSPLRPTVLANDDVFAPGIWYKDNVHVPKNALASRPDNPAYFFREDRLPLPLIMTRDKRSGTTLALLHLGGRPATFAGEDGLTRIVDARLQFGALGILNTSRPAPTFVFPGTEGPQTYLHGGHAGGERWAYRSHPVRVGVMHQYRLLIQISQTPDFPAAVRRAWRTAYRLQHPPVIEVDLAKVYRDSVNLLAAYCHPYDGVISIPFAATVPDGRVNDTSSEMGFVGQALPAAALLLQDGLATGNTAATAHAEQVVDFWAGHAMTPSGVPKTWYDIHANGTVTWRAYHTFLRVASDGMDGALQAWNVLRAHGQDRPGWLGFCCCYGDWLTQAQHADGSWAREYDFVGSPVNPNTDTTDQPIPFLTDLFLATGDPRYKRAALQAGAFCWHAVHQNYAYVGGTPDNPNVMDKEGGMMALAAFLSLYDLTHDARWLRAASQAAWYSETWVYCWEIPIPADDPKVVYPKNRTTYGLSLIAAGHSGVDNYMAAAPFFYYRLWLLTGETHFRDVARMLLHDTKQMLDWDGTLGYAYPGLLTEVLSLAPPRGHGQTHWLPWLTVAILEPMVRLRETFGDWDIDQIEALPKAERLRRENAFSRTHGFGFAGVTKEHPPRVLPLPSHR